MHQDRSLVFTEQKTDFLTSQDIIALVVQAVGGAKAAIAAENFSDPNPVRLLGNVPLAPWILNITTGRSHHVGWYCLPVR